MARWEEMTVGELDQLSSQLEILEDYLRQDSSGGEFADVVRSAWLLIDDLCDEREEQLNQ